MDTNEEIAESRKRRTLFPGAHSTGNSLEGILDVPPKSHKRFAEASQKQNASRSKLQRTHGKYLTIFQETDQLKAPGLKSKLPVKEGSPWNLYRRYLTLELGGTVAVVGKTNQTGLFLMRGYRNDCAEENLDPLAVLQHPNLLQYHDCFRHDNAFYVVFEYAEMSIKELMEIRLDESELVAIVHQIVECLAYLEQMKTCHGAVNESNILLTRQGHVKIANLEKCTEMNAVNERNDVQALGSLMNHFMGLQNGNGTHISEEVAEWSPEAVDFWKMTMSWSAGKLKRHPLLKGEPDVSRLQGLVVMAQVSATRHYDF